jgi:hypothetical protein
MVAASDLTEKRSMKCSVITSSLPEGPFLCMDHSSFPQLKLPAGSHSELSRQAIRTMGQMPSKEKPDVRIGGTEDKDRKMAQGLAHLGHGLHFHSKICQ